ncbi:hypothetical protein QOZ80_7BG0599420 [Eleusine coracana subsp. coracana]|nr:hypothetical protein QOZ80_7BG0599420 [Eleusine coracana subsp. coracana]
MSPCLCHSSRMCSLLALFVSQFVSILQMVLLHHLPALFSLLMLISRATADGNFTVSKAVYYPNSDTRGTENGACEYGAFGATLNGGDVSASPSLYRNGVGCGACYQIRCTNPYYCSPNGVTIVVTDSGASDGTDFILSQHAFAQMGQNKDAGATLLNLGYVGIEYRRVSCIYPGKNIVFKVTESSHFPYYLEFEIWYQQGYQDITAVQLCETVNLTCQLLSRTHGAVWAAVSPPSGPLSIRMLFSNGALRSGEQNWLVPTSTIPQNWMAGATYESGVQVQLQ